MDDLWLELLLSGEKMRADTVSQQLRKVRYQIQSDEELRCFADRSSLSCCSAVRSGRQTSSMGPRKQLEVVQAQQLCCLGPLSHSDANAS
eukprot:1482670-Amphidinium_carterae.2